jgi:hypothetical protein
MTFCIKSWWLLALHYPEIIQSLRICLITEGDGQFLSLQVLSSLARRQVLSIPLWRPLGKYVLPLEEKAL